MGYKCVYFICLIIVANLAFSQQNSVFNNHSFQPFDRYVYNADNRFHTSIKPYNMIDVAKIVSFDTLFMCNTGNKYADYILNKDIFSFSKGIFNFSINPACNFEYSQDLDDTVNGWTNTRGLIIESDITNKVHVFTAFYETQSRYRDYRNDRIEELGQRTIPGQSRAKPFGDDNQADDYAFADAYISFNPDSIFGFQFGHGKHFIGDGYRSLLLSDNAMNYPYFKITTNIWNIQYVNMWSQQYYVDFLHAPNSRYPKKWNVMHYLDWSVTKWFNIGIFETIIWQNEDSSGVYRGFEFNYLNPVIFLRPVEFSVGSPDNVLMGLTGKVTLWKNHVFYGQLAIDEFKISEMKVRNGWWGNKYALQAGYKTFDIAGVKHLDFQTEVNYVRPFMYSHFTYSQQYGHALQSMAHPRGSNFYESVSFIKYNYKRLFIEAKYLYLVHGQDTVGSNFGNNIFKLYTTRSQEYNNKTGKSAIENIVQYKDITVSYLVHPPSNTTISAGISNRSAISELNSKQQMMYFIALRSSLQNFYYDF